MELAIPKIDKLRAFGGEHDVRGLDVAVQNPTLTPVKRATDRYR
jgi:hypothetical protein